MQRALSEEYIQSMIVVRFQEYNKQILALIDFEHSFFIILHGRSHWKLN